MIQQKYGCRGGVLKFMTGGLRMDEYQIVWIPKVLVNVLADFHLNQDGCMVSLNILGMAIQISRDDSL